MKTKLFLFIAVLFSAFSVNAQITSIEITGGSIGGWGTEGVAGPHQMTTTDNINYTISGLIATTTGGGCKFRANNSWVTPSLIWGGSGPSSVPTNFPSDAGAQPGNDIQIQDGTWIANLNVVTGAYSFTPDVPPAPVKLIGSGVNPSTGILMTPTATDVYSLTTTLLAGTIQFDVDGTVVGGTGYPTGNASSPTQSTPVVAGLFKITFNNATGDYVIEPVSLVVSVAIVGAATTGNWPDNDPLTPDPIPLKNVDNLNLKYRISEIELTVNNCKFRENGAWTVTWGGSFPTQAAALGGGDIAVTPAGTYSVTLDYITNTYNFFTPKVGIIGQAIGGWGDANEVQMSTTDGITYLLLNQNFPNTDGCKFRLDQNWDKSWRGAFPSGTADTGNGANINVTAGTYDVRFNRLTGDFIFATPGTLANNSFATKAFSVSPNPTNNNWKIASANDITSVQVVNVLGKVVYTSNTIANEINVDASALSNGVYFARIASANAVETVKLIKN